MSSSRDNLMVVNVKKKKHVEKYREIYYANECYLWKKNSISSEFVIGGRL